MLNIEPENKLSKSGILLLILSVFFFIADFFNKYLTLSLGQETSVSIYIRSFFAIYFVLSSLIFINKNRLVILIFLILLFLGYLISGSFSYFRDLSLYMLIKYIYIYILALYFLGEVYTVKDLKRIKYLFRFFVIFNAFAILLGFIFELDFFKTYYLWPWRTGYDGFFPGQNEATFFYIFALILYFKFNDRINVSNLEKLILIISILFVGTKGLYLFTLLFFTYLFKRFFIPLVVISLLFICFNLEFTYQLLYLKSEFLYDVLINKGFFYMVLSGRNELFENNFDIINNWNFINYLFGGQSIIQLTELGFVDLFLFFGLIGGVIYLTGYFYILYNIKLLSLCPFCIFLIFLINALQSHLFDSALIPMYLILLGIIVKNQK